MMKEIRMWGDVRTFCINHNYYTRGDNRAYQTMLDYVYDNKPTTEAIEIVARDILKHSDDPENTVTNVMFQLFREAVTVFFEEDK